MFTGIIEAVGEIKRVTPLQKGISLRITSPELDLSDIRVGDSIALNGVCLTVTAFGNREFSVDVSRETLNCTEGLDKQGGRVNLEKALRLSDRLDGHLVSGHVDGVGEMVKFEQTGESYLLAIKAPGLLLKYIARKGSITINGVSLTVNRLIGGYIRSQPYSTYAGRNHAGGPENRRQGESGSRYARPVYRKAHGSTRVIAPCRNIQVSVIGKFVNDR